MYGTGGELTYASLPYEEKIKHASPIAYPMAPEKLARRLFKLTRKAKKCKKMDSSIKSVLKAIEKKNASGILVLAGDASPIDATAHIPIVCEEFNIPYCYVPSKVDISANSGSVGFLPMVFIVRSDEYGDLYDKCFSAVDQLSVS
ncbi:H/ACA ribonucleo protein complex subunit 2 [Fasciola hepatica]|uniref:H/ACA ribonucleo protein complex subunit 2 n=1 Tax=Fasciola hepatica TaxID=6192 RepID=A0A2H1C3S3_FASHE|nr:H/ACA ribonucleo protein complex subunit 2 [Fasciola hepatica]